ncbi:hypothetical protein ACP70R_037375 [Stipagrostis hirtigluma subsp. patula]
MTPEQQDSYLRSIACEAYARFIDPTLGMTGINCDIKVELQKVEDELERLAAPASCGSKGENKGDTKIELQKVEKELEGLAAPTSRSGKGDTMPELEAKGRELFGVQGWARLLDVFPDMYAHADERGDTNARADPVRGAVTMLRALLGEAKGGICEGSHADAAAFLRWMLPTPPVAPSPAPTRAENKKPCGACKEKQRKCEQSCPFAPYFPPGSEQQFRNLRKVFDSCYISTLNAVLSSTTPAAPDLTSPAPCAACKLGASVISLTWHGIYQLSLQGKTL